MTSQQAKNGRRRPTGRRTGDSGTRDAILDAALALFAEHGYDGASVRAIASRAGVDPALIRHFFGDKEGLFTVALADRTAVYQRFATSLEGPPETLGRRVADTALRLWAEPESQPLLLALVRSSTTSPHAAEMLRGILGARLAAVESSIHAVQRQRFSLAASHLFGLAFARHVIALPPLATMDHDTLVDLVAPVIQHYLTDPP